MQNPVENPRPDFEKLENELKEFWKEQEHDDSVPLGQFTGELAKIIVEHVPTADLPGLLGSMRGALALEKPKEKTGEPLAGLSLSAKKGLAWAHISNYVDGLKNTF